MPAPPGAFARSSRVSEFSTTVFPARLSTFRRLDVYGWNDVGEMAYYSDGFFAFALYHVDARLSVESISEAREWEGCGDLLAMVPTGHYDPRVGYERRGMALHGDLPVDMQAQVLEGLPAPARPNLLDRILSLLGR